MGGFFEAYAIDNEKEKCNIETLTKISHICDMQISRKSKTSRKRLNKRTKRSKKKSKSRR